MQLTKITFVALLVFLCWGQDKPKVKTDVVITTEQQLEFWQARAELAEAQKVYKDIVDTLKAAEARMNASIQALQKVCGSNALELDKETHKPKCGDGTKKQ